MYWRISVAAAFLLAFSVVPAQAEQSFAVNIPFTFEAGEQKMPAGAYDVKFPNSNTVLIQCADRTCAAFMLTNGVSTRDGWGTAKLVFNRYGNRHFLNQVWSHGYDRGRQVPKSKGEIEVARDASRAGGREVATVLPNRQDSR
jgi:hypothetical protein